MPNFRASVGHPPKINVKRANPITFSGQEVGLTLGSGTFSYTPSHYVAPFASVSGAANDYADLGATSWSNAANSGTPTTLGTAMARATSSNGLLGLAAKVQCAAGVYSGLVSGANKTPVFMPTNSGTSGNPIVFFAQYSAANNYGSTSLYSELRTNGTLSTGSTASPAIGTNGQDYVIFDGFFTKFSTCIPAPSGGTIGLADCIGCEVRRCAVVCDVFGINTNYPGYNGNHLFAEQADSSAFRDNHLVAASSVHHNDAQCELYGCRPFSIVNNTFAAGDYKHGPFVKGSSPTPTSSSTVNNNVTISYNRVTGSILVGNCDTAEIHHNLILHNQNTGRQSAMMTYSDWKDLRWYNNTVVMGGSSPYVMTFWNVATGLTPGTSARIYDNIMVNEVSPYNMILFNDGDMVVGSNAQIATWWDQIDGNVYWGGTSHNPRYTDGAGTAFTGISNWQSQLTSMGMVAGAREANSIVSDPLFVGGGDYTLQGGSPAAGKGCYVTGSEEIGVRSNPTY